MGIYDIGIIGGGTAGMTAAIYGQRAGKQTILFEGTTFGGQITSSPNVENYPGIASVSGSEFSMNLMDQAVKLGTQTIMEQVTGIREEEDYKVIVTTEKEYECKSIILATGVTHRHLGVPGEERLTGAGVSYCATCDGMFYRNKTVMVIGGGNTAAADAMTLSRICKMVILVHRRDSLRATKIYHKQLEETTNIEFYWNTTVSGFLYDKKLTAAKLHNVKTGADTEISIDGAFISIGRKPSSELFEGILDMDEAGYIIADESTRTNIPGVFAIGDVRTKALRQVVTAVADGATASHYIEEYLAGKM